MILTLVLKCQNVHERKDRGIKRIKRETVIAMDNFSKNSQGQI